MGLLMAAGPILLGVLIVFTEALQWPRKMHYVWATIAIVFGVGLFFI